MKCNHSLVKTFRIKILHYKETNDKMAHPHKTSKNASFPTAYERNHIVHVNVKPMFFTIPYGYYMSKYATCDRYSIISSVLHHLNVI